MFFDEHNLFSNPAWDLSGYDNLSELEEKIKTCNRCVLRSGCRSVVFGEGSSKASLVLCGEGPGADEDLQGRPFVGRAGQLLDKILQACGFERFGHAYILNVVKCRPPGNRTPSTEEITACSPNLQAQLRILKPKILVLLGAAALQALLDPKGKISRERGNWVRKGDLLIMPTYHPAALLRNPNLKKETWEDFKQVVAKYRELVDPNHYSSYC